MVRWIITKYQHEWVENRLRVLIWTDQPLHAFLHYSLSPEIFAYMSGERRGIRRIVTPLWELPDPITLEQNVRGDTLCHVFLIPGVPPGSTLTFYISGTSEGIEAKSVSIPIRITHPNQDLADPVDPQDFVDCQAFDPWTQNQKDAVGIHDDCWNTSGMTGTATLSVGWDRMYLSIGGTPGSVAEIYTNRIFDLQLDHTLHSQLRAIVWFPIVTANTHAHIIHGTRVSDSAYGFEILNNRIYGWRRWSTGALGIGILDPCVAGILYLLEAKYKPGESVEWWINGDFKAKVTTNLPDTGGAGFFARIEDPDTAHAAIGFRRLMIWKQSIWTS